MDESDHLADRLPVRRNLFVGNRSEFCITREEFEELKQMVQFIYGTMKKQEKKTFPATSTKKHEKIVNEKFLNASVPCQSA